MKRFVIMLLSVAACVCLSGCFQAPVPEGAADGAAWDESWVAVGNVVGVDTPAGIDAREYSDTLGHKGMYYATWSIGEETPYVNADGDGTVIYDAQFYLLLAGYNSVEKAENALADWQSMAASNYALEGTAESVYNGQAFTVMTYTYSSETNPYQRGTSAFGIYRNYAISVEISCQEDFDGDAQSLLADFLEHCHYAA